LKIELRKKTFQQIGTAITFKTENVHERKIPNDFLQTHSINIADHREASLSSYQADPSSVDQALEGAAASFLVASYPEDRRIEAASYPAPDHRHLERALEDPVADQEEQRLAFHDQRL
jgi:hypothetical protein